MVKLKIYKKNKSGIIFLSITKIIVSYIKLNNNYFLLNKDNNRIYNIKLNKPNFIFDNIPYYVFNINITNQLEINSILLNEIIDKLKYG